MEDDSRIFNEFLDAVTCGSSLVPGTSGPELSGVPDYLHEAAGHDWRRMKRDTPATERETGDEDTAARPFSFCP